MPRLPTPGSDEGAWGAILNEFLTQSHNSDGTLRPSAMVSSGAESLSSKGQPNGYASLDSSGSIPLANLPVATTTSRGSVRLSGDLGGTADAPTVPGLNAKANDSSVVHTSGNETISGVKTFATSPVAPSPSGNTDVANKGYVDAAVASSAPDATAVTRGLIQLAGDLAGSAASPTVPGLAAKAALGANSDITSLSGLTTPLTVGQGGTGNTAGVTKQVLIYVAAANASARSKAGADYVATGTNDDTTLNAAIAALPAGGGTVQLSEGLFSVAAASLTLRSNLRIVGSGTESSKIQLANAANGRLISSSTVLSSITFENVIFDGNAANQSDGAIRDDRSMLFLNNITDLRIIDCTITNCRHGAALRMSTMTNVIVEGCRFVNNGTAASVYACDHSFCGDTDYYRVFGNYYDTSLDTGTAQDGVRWSTVTSNVYKNNVLGVSISASSARPSQYNTITGNVIEGTGSTTTLSYGIKVSKFGSAVAANMTEGAIVGNVIRNCDRAMWIEQMDRLQISSNVMADAAGTNKQLMIISTVGTSTDVSIDNNLFYNTTNRGISFSGAGTQNNTRVTNNRFISVTTPIAGTIPAGTIIRQNQGYITENSGTATVLSGTTSIVVNHGLSATPSAANIVTSPTNNLGTATKFWVNTITATQFTINVDADPGATTATFSWQVTIL